MASSGSTAIKQRYCRAVPTIRCDYPHPICKYCDGRIEGRLLLIRYFKEHKKVQYLLENDGGSLKQIYAFS